jgi:phosphopantothenoylcysteine decarboxylase/phosphopantothenate--cysteine ligase
MEFAGFKDLNSKMRALLKDQTFDAVIHLAAVSDYSVDSIGLGSKRLSPGRGRKIDSKADPVTLVLKRNFKILDRIKDYALAGKKPYRPLVVGFKLTVAASKAGALGCIRSLKSADFVVHNDLREVDNAKHSHIFHIYKNGVKICDCPDAPGLAAELNARLQQAKAEAEAKKR